MKKVLLVLVGLGIVGFFAFAVLSQPKDQELIAAALDDSVAAAAEGRPSPVLSNLSSDFKYGDETFFAGDIAKVIRDAKPTILIVNKAAEISGDKAVVKTPVKLTMNYMGMSMDSTLPDVTIELRKETGVKWLFVPVPKWRITSVRSESLPNY
ncbi:hypothetical protein QPK87_31910 [Kamptonema cortianum]|nr:hypothetical protein [Kamptonema cortianum]